MNDRGNPSAGTGVVMLGRQTAVVGPGRTAMNPMIRIAAVLVLTLGWIAPTPQAAAGGGCHGVELTDRATTTVTTAGPCFTPTVARIATGEELKFVNADGMEHNVTPVAAAFNALQREQTLRSGGSLAFRFVEPGVYPYVCTLHPTMAGAVVVGDGIPAGQGAAAPTQPATATSPETPTVVVVVVAAVLALALVAALRRRSQPHPG